MTEDSKVFNTTTADESEHKIEVGVDQLRAGCTTGPKSEMVGTK